MTVMRAVFEIDLGLLEPIRHVEGLLLGVTDNSAVIGRCARTLDP